MLDRSTSIYENQSDMKIKTVTKGSLTVFFNYLCFSFENSIDSNSYSVYWKGMAQIIYFSDCCF